MKLQSPNQQSRALTLVEVLVILAVIAVLAVLLLPFLAAAKKKSSRIQCVNNLMQIGSAFRIWESDHANKYPTQPGATNGGVMELAAAGDVAAVFQVLSNELSTPWVLICPADTKRHRAADFTANFGNRNISYFVGLDARDEYPTAILAGDDNFEINGTSVKSGVLLLSTNTPIAWTAARHHFSGNVGLADGSVQSTTDSGLTNAFLNQYAGPSGFTNRFWIAIP